MIMGRWTLIGLSAVTDVLFPPKGHLQAVAIASICSLQFTQLTSSSCDGGTEHHPYQFRPTVLVHLPIYGIIVKHHKVFACQNHITFFAFDLPGVPAALEVFSSQG